MRGNASQNIRDKMQSVELFAGCGGLALGMAQAGFNHRLVVECDKDSINTLTENKERKVKHIRHWKIEQSDVREMKYHHLEGVDLLSGGPPCQPFSIGGKHLGPKDSRNMWPEAARSIREMRPKAFVFENVRGLFRPDFSRYLEYIHLQLSYPDIEPRIDEGWEEHLMRLTKHSKNKNSIKDYRVVSRVINTADYGAPQRRHRAIFIGIDKAFGEEWDFPEPTHSREALVWAKHIDLSYWEGHEMQRISKCSSPTEQRIFKRLSELGQEPKKLPWMTVRDAIADLPRPSKKEIISGHWQHPGAKVYPNHTGCNFDEPAKALKAGNNGVPGGENMLVQRNGSVRYFTVREMARLQGLPDEYIISGSWKAATRQLGNAVPAMISERIGRAVMNILQSKKQDEGYI